MKQFPHFETQTPDEETIIFARAHFFTNIWWILLVIVMLTVPLILKLIPLGESANFGLNISGETQLLLVLSWYLFVAAFAFQRFLHWLFNVYIVTNKRLVDIDFFNIFYKQISSALLNSIEDVTHRKGGIAQFLFNYGDLFVQTAAASPNFEFHSIPDPNNVQKKIISLIPGKHGSG